MPTIWQRCAKWSPARLTNEIGARLGGGAAPAHPAPPGDERVGQVHPLGSFLKYNLFKRRDGIIAVPMRIGPVDPNVYELRVNPDVIASRGLISARIEILCVWVRWAFRGRAKT